MRILNYNLPFGIFVILCYICTVFVGWSYGNSYAVYVAFSVGMALFAYPVFFSKRNQLNPTVKGLLTCIAVLSIFLGFVNGDLKSPILVNISLLMPVSLSTLNITYDRLHRQVIMASLVNLLIIFVIGSNFDVWNSNSLAFMIFGGISVGMVWFKIANSTFSRVCSCGYLMLGTSLLLVSESRNAGICIVICFAMLLISQKFYRKLIVYRFIYVSVLLATVFATDVMISVLSDQEISEYLLSFTNSFSQKSWGMDTHYLLLQEVAYRFENRDLFAKIFGLGIKSGHTHNLFYQCLMFYGYVGTIIIYLFYVYVFERAYKLIKYKGDIMTLSCFIILIGHFLLHIGE
ncbi:MAG: hypothetical protein K2G01_03700, partial [Paramuribaculum sp.]|nr:hypothetical protein [Paramuribaculum sp.]